MIFTTAILSILACIATVTMEAAMSNDRSIIGTIVEGIEWCRFSLMLLSASMALFSLAMFARAALQHHAQSECSQCATNRSLMS